MEEKKKARYGFILLVGLLFFRLIWLGVGRYIYRIYFPYDFSPLWLENIYITGTYLLTGLFLYLERDRLREYHITSGVLWIILLSPLVVPFTHWAFGGPLFVEPINWQWSWVFIWPQSILAVIFLYVYLRNRKSFRLDGDKFRWVTAASLIGVLTSVLLIYLVKRDGIYDPHPMSIPIVLTMFISQVGLAGVNEEPLFRGFLWGYLKQRKMPEFWILLVQTFLFGLAHIYHLQRHPSYFWILVPVAGLVMGYVAWRSRSIVTSMIVHGLINTIVLLLPYFIQLPQI